MSLPFTRFEMGLLGAVVFATLAMSEEPDAGWITTLAAKARADYPAKLPQRKADLAEQKKRLAAAKRGRINEKVSQPTTVGSYVVYPNKASKEKTVADLEKRVAELTRQVGGECPIPLLSASERPAVGDAGHAPVMHVKQVVSGNEAIVRFYSVVIVPGPNGPQSGRAEFDAWLEHDTSEWSDGQVVNDFNLPIVVHATKQYATAGGSTRTLPAIRCWTDGEIARFRELAKAK